MVRGQIMSEARAGCPVSRRGRQQPCQNHGASGRTAIASGGTAQASRISGAQALRTGASCALVSAAVARCKDKTLYALDDVTYVYDDVTRQARYARLKLSLGHLPVRAKW